MPFAHPKRSCGDCEHLLDARGFLSVLNFVGEGSQHQYFNFRNGFNLRRAICHRTGKRRHFRNPSAIVFSFDFDLHAVSMARTADPASASLPTRQALLCQALLCRPGKRFFAERSRSAALTRSEDRDPNSAITSEKGQMVSVRSGVLLARIGKTDEPSKRVRCTGNDSTEDEQITMQSTPRDFADVCR